MGVVIWVPVQPYPLLLQIQSLTAYWILYPISHTNVSKHSKVIIFCREKCLIFNFHLYFTWQGFISPLVSGTVSYLMHLAGFHLSCTWQGFIFPVPVTVYHSCTWHCFIFPVPGRVSSLLYPAGFHLSCTRQGFISPLPGRVSSPVPVRVSTLLYLAGFHHSSTWQVFIFPVPGRMYFTLSFSWQEIMDAVLGRPVCRNVFFIYFSKGCQEVFFINVYPFCSLKYFICYLLVRVLGTLCLQSLI